MTDTPLADAMQAKLQSAFSPSHLEIIDESALHAGHRGASEHSAEHGAGESHFKIVIVADGLAGLSRLARQRAVLDAISDEVAQIHAISISASAPN
jgi:BolA protein